jgi:hypothetical protein
LWAAGGVAVLASVALLVAAPAFGATITSMIPASGDVLADDSPYCDGSPVQLNGTGFVTDGPTSSVVVRFNGVPATYVEIGSNIVLYTRVPKGATNGKITVTTAAGTAESPTGFEVQPCEARAGTNEIDRGSSTPSTGATAATVKSFAPASGKPGTKVKITGTNLNTATALTFGGVKATFVKNSATQVTATVPAKAKTGKIVVTNSAGKATSAKNFVVT